MRTLFCAVTKPSLLIPPRQQKTIPAALAKKYSQTSFKKFHKHLSKNSRPAARPWKTTFSRNNNFFTEQQLCACTDEPSGSLTARTSCFSKLLKFFVSRTCQRSDGFRTCLSVVLAGAVKGHKF